MAHASAGGTVAAAAPAACALAAAAAAAGYAQSFNVLQGFEGDKNDKGQRNTVGGWRAAGLPWVQG